MEITQEQFLQEYFKDKSDCKLIRNHKSFSYTEIRYKYKDYRIRLLNHDNVSYCEIDTIKIHIAKFIIPKSNDSYNKLKQLLDIFLGVK